MYFPWYDISLHLFLIDISHVLYIRHEWFSIQNDSWFIQKQARYSSRSCGARVRGWSYYFFYYFLVVFLLHNLKYSLVIFLYNELWHMHKQEMELPTCVCTSCHFCQLFTDHWRGRSSFLSFNMIILFYLIFFISFLSSFPNLEKTDCDTCHSV